MERTRTAAAARGGVTLALFLIAAVALPSVTLAQTPPEVDVQRNSDELKTLVVPDPTRPSTDSALVFTNPGGLDAYVRCNAYDANGNWVGRTRTLVPARGLRYIRASDLSGGAAFLGQAKCWSVRHVIGSGFIVAPGGITPTSVLSHRHEVTQYFRFPVVITS